MNFEQYYSINTSNIQESIIDVSLKSEKNNTINTMIAEQINNPWYITKDQNNIYLHYKDKQINISLLKKELDKVYSKYNLENSGFARLSEKELINSKKIKNYLLKLFNNSNENILDPINCANFLKNKDYVGNTFNNIEESKKLLTEEPHVELEDEYGDFRFWDFCAEERFHNLSNGGWLQQLINLYTPPYKIRSLNPNKNDPRVLELKKEELPDITKALINNPFFINIAKHDLKAASAKFNLKLKSIIPSELYAKIN